jgi:hypothetical protein
VEKVYRATVKKPITLVAVLSHGKDIIMTDEDKKRISEYMRWNIVMVGPQKSPYPIYVDNIDSNIHHRFDSNDAALCVQEMQKRGDWQKFCATGFVIYFEKKIPIHIFPENYIAWLSNAENFFNAMSEWLKEGK